MLAPTTVRLAMASATALALALGGGGCSNDRAAGSEPRAAESSSTSSASASPSVSASQKASRSATALADGCLLSAGEVEQVLAGDWQIRQRDRLGCVYSSSRGAVFVLRDVQEPDPVTGLNDARMACIGRREVPASNAFACTEDKSNGTTVVGNFIADDRLWLAVLPARTGVDHRPEFNAVIAVMTKIDEGH